MLLFIYYFWRQGNIIHWRFSLKAQRQITEVPNFSRNRGKENAGRTTRKVIVDQMDPFRLRAQVGEHILIGPRPGRCTDREGEGDCGEQQRT
eukprot:scaffold9436_cov13-Tisochrysis_lutea.AAC.1